MPNLTLMPGRSITFLSTRTERPLDLPAGVLGREFTAEDGRQPSHDGRVILCGLGLCWRFQIGKEIAWLPDAIALTAACGIEHVGGDDARPQIGPVLLVFDALAELV